MRAIAIVAVIMKGIANVIDTQKKRIGAAILSVRKGDLKGVRSFLKTRNTKEAVAARNTDLQAAAMSKSVEN